MTSYGWGFPAPFLFHGFLCRQLLKKSSGHEMGDPVSG